MTIHYDWQTTTTTRVTVTGDTEAERVAAEEELRARGYRCSLWVTGVRWEMVFVREVAVDTDNKP